MPTTLSLTSPLSRSMFILLLSVACFSTAFAHTAGITNGKAVYDNIKAFDLNGGNAAVTGLVLKRDRVTITFNGTFYLTSPIAGKVTGAVFIGQGTFKADTPPGDFEKANVRRMLKADTIESSFTSAVLKFSDDTFDIIGKDKKDGVADAAAVKLASEIEARMLKETGINISQRIAISILNNEQPGGVFFGHFDGGTRGRFSYVFDPQTRIPTNDFNINAGEKGVIFKYDSGSYGADVWTAFYGMDNYAKGTVYYSDLYDMVDIQSYKMNVNLTSPKKGMGLNTKVKMRSNFAGIRAIPFSIGESLSNYEDQRLKKQMRVKAVRMGTTDIPFVQEDWQGGFSVFLPEALGENKEVELEFDIDGDFIRQPQSVEDVHYPRSNEAWYPRHGFLDRAVYDFTYSHAKKMKIASVGVRQSETPHSETKDVVVTRYTMTHPVALVTFAMGPFDRHTENIKWDDGSAPTPIEFHSMPGAYMAIKEDFILAELNNSVRFFHQLFGKYPYDVFGAAFHPYGFGQGFPSMLMIPDADRSSKYTFAFLSHETAHQWWGNIVSWRSYRDQWLSEGFAEYSGLLYTSMRQNPAASNELLNSMRQSIKDPPITETGIGKGRLNDVGPLILGHRLTSRKTYGAYQSLIYNKGGMVLRMVHFLLTDPASGDDKPFYAMMKEFVEKHRNGMASSDDFRIVANKHFAQTPIAKKYGMTDMNWFFQQWVYQTDLPSYKLQHQIENNPDGSVNITGEIFQENVSLNFVMVLPLVFKFDGGKSASGTIAVQGAKSQFKIKLPSRPSKVELDPHKWILSEKTSSN